MTNKGFWLILCAVIPFWLQAQDPGQNRHKYDVLKQRFHEKFVLLADDATTPGAFIPMERRIPQNDGTTTGYWADGTWWLGHYVATLAMEYKLLGINKIDNKQTKEELRNALLTYFRLDTTAETCWNAPACRNSFYVRDDVSDAAGAPLHIAHVASDYASYCGDLTTIKNGPSQDQAWGTYLGLALTLKLVDDDSIKALAKNVARMMVKSLQSVQNEKEVWEVIHPVTGKIVQKRGDLQWLRYAHASAFQTLTDTAMTFGHAQRSFWKSAWNFMQNNFMIDKHGHFNWYGILVISTVINDNGRGADNLYDWVAKCCQKLARKRPDLQQPLLFPHLPLIAGILYGTEGATLLPDSLYENLLDSAPLAGGFRTSADDNAPHTPAPWHTLSLFCPWHNRESGEYNMLDYLLLYNAYELFKTECPMQK